MTKLRNLGKALLAYLFYHKGSKVPKSLKKYLKGLKDKSLEEILDEYKPLKKKLQYSPELSDSEYKLFKDVLIFLEKGSEPALKRIFQNLKKNYPDIYSDFKKEFGDKDGISIKETDARKLVNKLRKVVKKLTGKDALQIVSVEDRREAKKKNEELYKKFLKLRRDLRKVQQKIAEKIYEKEGLIPIEKLNKVYKKIGIPSPFPPGLQGVLVDHLLKLYTKDGKPIYGVPPTESEVTMNKNPEENGFVFTAKLPNGNVLYYYTEEFIKKNRIDKKFNSVLRALDRVKDYRKKWLRFLNSKDKRKRILALLLELLYQTQARVGTSVPKKERKGGYGLSTLKVKHIKFEGNTAILSYRGKKGVRQKHIIKDKKLVELLKELVKGKDKNDFLFTYPDGKRVRAEDINRFAKNLGIPFTVHKFRHIIGTQMAKKLLLGTNRKFRDPKKAVEFFKKQLTKIGKVLGHRTGEKVTWTTAKDNYIDPEVMLEFFRRQGIRIPSFLQKFVK